ncbi:MAG TPA: 1,4-dihydroxy-2-naphthoate octaprenyltransferase [bacterium]|nr:1,4-dihydroxy-2-naphthoate octaprenyltransferase [bacterium]
MDAALGRRPAWAAVWWQAIRPYSLTASVTPVLVGTAAAAAAGVFHPAPFLATLVAAAAIHAGTNLVNDYYDHIRGVDAGQPIGPGGAIQRNELTPRTVLAGAVVLFALGGALGLWLVALRGWPILLVGVLSILAGYAYTGGPLPLGYVALGDITVFLFMGVLIVTGAAYVQTGAVLTTAVWASLPVAALVDGILVVNNLRDLENDRARGKRTLATVIGRRATRWHALMLLVGAYAAVGAGVLRGVLPSGALLSALTAPAAREVWRVVRGADDPLALTVGGVRGMAQLHLKLGLLLAAGLLLPALSRAL